MFVQGFNFQDTIDSAPGIFLTKHTVVARLFKGKKPGWFDVRHIVTTTICTTWATHNNSTDEEGERTQENLSIETREMSNCTTA